MPEYGWLSVREDLPWTIRGVDVSPETRTRREEYTWVANRLASEPRSVSILDVATGYVPTWHMMPYIAAAMGFDHIMAIDENPATLAMPACDGVVRQIGNMLALPFADDSFDVVLCVSTLEHLSLADARQAMAEIARVARRRVILTADEAPWLPILADEAGMVVGFDAGPTASDLTPPVYAVDAAVL